MELNHALLGVSSSAGRLSAEPPHPPMMSLNTDSVHQLPHKKGLLRVIRALYIHKKRSKPFDLLLEEAATYSPT